MLPLNGVVEVGSDSGDVFNGDHQKINSHAEVSEGEIAHQKLGHRHTEPEQKSRSNEDLTSPKNILNQNRNPNGVNEINNLFTFE